MKHIYIIVACIYGGCLSIPFFLYGENAHIHPFDNLDSNVNFFKLLALSGEIFSSNQSVIPQTHGGAYRISFPSEFFYLTWLYVLFTPFMAYTVNYIFVKVMAFISAYVLSFSILRITETRCTVIRTVSILIGLIFSFTPFWQHAGLSVAGMPLLIYGYLALHRNSGNLHHYMIILLFPFFSNYFVSSFFFYLVLGVIILIEGIYKKRICWPIAITALGATAIEIIVNYRLFLNMLDPIFISHRVEFKIPTYGLDYAWNQIKENTLNGQAHVRTNSLPTIFILVGILISSKIMRPSKIFLIATSTLTISILIFGFWRTAYLYELKDSIPFFNQFNFSRIHWLQPTLWLLVIVEGFRFILVKTNIKKPKLISTALCITLLFQLGYSAYKSDHWDLYKVGKISWRLFYSEDQFVKVKSIIEANKLRGGKSLVVGFHPDAASFNDIVTLGGYLAIYPLSYKRKFLNMIDGELQLNPVIKGTLENWGNRLYAYSSEIGKSMYHRKPISTYRLDRDIFESLGGEFVLSSVEINHLPEFQKIATIEGYRKIRIYQHIE